MKVLQEARSFNEKQKRSFIFGALFAAFTYLYAQATSAAYSLWKGVYYANNMAHPPIDPYVVALYASIVSIAIYPSIYVMQRVFFGLLFDEEKGLFSEVNE